MLKNKKLSKFKKILYVLLIILIIEAILIYFNHKNNTKTSTNKNPKNMLVLVDATSNILSVFENDKLLKSYVVAAGKPSTPSPIGTWKIISKGTWGEGFGGRWMGFNVPWGKYGIHGTNKPYSIGWNSSKGCIRMRNKDVASLYKLLPYGTPVIIWSGPYGNFGSNLRTLKPGMTGADMYEIQKILKDKGYYKGNPNGMYSQNMKSVFHKFQRDNKIPVTDTIGNAFYKKLGIELLD
ncbi:L,D-transpeptidase family protein [Clostridium oceanicum]|uniref:L,D-transpeptidase family protein n=1 Tax=Clostridium oceanicum TaxID=1543 RepID=A0ABP3V988_9CLOT